MNKEVRHGVLRLTILVLSMVGIGAYAVVKEDQRVAIQREINKRSFEVTKPATNMLELSGNIDNGLYDLIDVRHCSIINESSELTDDLGKFGRGDSRLYLQTDRDCYPEIPLQGSLRFDPKK